MNAQNQNPVAPGPVDAGPATYTGPNDQLDDPNLGSKPRAYAATGILADAERKSSIGWTPILTVAFNLQGKRGVQAAQEYGVTVQAAPSGFPTPTPDLHLSIAYLEARAFAWMIAADPEAIIFCLTRRVCLNLTPNGRVFDFRVANTFFPEAVDARVRPHVCGHDPIECSCAVPTHLYFGPDIGSFTPEGVATLLEQTQSRTGYAMFPRITNIAGDLGPDMTYYYADSSTIVLTPKHSRPIRVVDPKWIHNLSYDTTGRRIKAQVIEQVHHWILYRISLAEESELVPASMPVPLRPWVDLDDAVNNPSSAYAMPQGSGKVVGSAFDWALFGIRSIHILSTIAVFTTHKEKRIVFSKEIAWAGARQYMNRPRSALTLQTVTRWTQGKYNAMTMLPEELKYPAQLATVVFIMSHCMHDELSAIMTLIHDCARIWAVHAETMAFRPPVDLTPTKVIAGVAYSALTAYTVNSVGTQAFNAMSTGNVLSSGHLLWHATAVKMAVAGAVATTPFHMPVVVPLWCITTTAAACWSWYKAHSTDGPKRVRIEEWVNTPPDEQPPPLPPGVYKLPVGTRFGATSATKKTFPEQDIKCKVIDAPFPEVKEPTAKVVAAGICLQEIARYHESNAANEAIALRNRTTIKTPAPRPGLWDAVSKAYLAHPFVAALATMLQSPDNKFWYNKEAVTRYAAKFPPTRRMELLEAFDEFRDRGYRFVADDFKASMFVKGELHVKPSFDGETPEHNVDEATPRAIISFRPIVNATLGPLVQFYSDKEREYRLWAHEELEHCPLAPRGVSGEVLGAWFTHWVMRFGGPECVYTLSKDSRKHDAHHSKDSRENSAKSNIDLVVCSRPEVKQVYVKQMTVKGKSAHGVIFAAEDKRWSGESSTSGANSHTTEQKACYALEGVQLGGSIKFDNLGENYALGSEGDDGTGVIASAWLDSTMPGDKVAVMTARCLELGFEDTIILRPGVDGDFCSRWWYPTEGGYLPGGKIGRVLAKAGFFYEASDEQSIRSAAIGALRDNGHVPFLREYFQRVCFLAKKQNLGLSGRPKEYSIHMARCHDYDDSTLDFVEVKYGLTRQDLAEWKITLSQVKSLPVVISWPHLERCLAIDNA